MKNKTLIWVGVIAAGGIGLYFLLRPSRTGSGGMGGGTGSAGSGTGRSDAEWGFWGSLTRESAGILDTLIGKIGGSSDDEVDNEDTLADIAREHGYEPEREVL